MMTRTDEKAAVREARIAAMPVLTSDDVKWLRKGDRLWGQGPDSEWLKYQYQYRGNGYVTGTTGIQLGSFDFNCWRIPPRTQRAVAKRKAEAARPAEQPEPVEPFKIGENCWLHGDVPCVWLKSLPGDRCLVYHVNLQCTVDTKPHRITARDVGPLKERLGSPEQPAPAAPGNTALPSLTHTASAQTKIGGRHELA